MPLTPKHPTIEAVETIIQYRFNHTALLWEALQCTGIASDSEGKPVPPGGNKRLAIVGDAVLRLALAEDWYKGSDTTADFSTQMQHLGSNKNLHRIGLELGLDRFINTPGDVSSATLRPVADTVEAILGAIFLDSGLEEVKDVMDALGLVPRERVEEGEVVVLD